MVAAGYVADYKSNSIGKNYQSQMWLMILIEWSLGNPIQKQGKPSLHKETFFTSQDTMNYLDSYLVILSLRPWLKLKTNKQKN